MSTGMGVRKDQGLLFRRFLHGKPMATLFLLLFTCFAPVLAQTPTVASLKAALPGLQGKERLAVLVDLANKLDTGSPQEALVYATEGVALARKVGDKEKEANLLSSKAFSYSQMGNFGEAVQFGKESLELSKQINNKERIAKAHNTLGITYTFMGMYSQALEEHLDALQIREELSLETASIQSLNNIGILYHNMGQYQQAIYYYNQILQRIANKNDNPRLILVKLNIGFAEYKLGHLSEAMRNHQEAFAIIKKTKNTTLLAYAYYNLGITYTDLKAYSQALHHLREALAEYRKQDQKHGRVQVLNALGRLYQRTGGYARAIPYAKEAANLAQQINAREELMASYELIADLYDHLDNLNESYKYYKLYVMTKDSIYTLQESRKIADITTKIMTLKKDNEIEFLKKEKIISALKFEKTRYLSIVLISGIAFLMALVLILIIYNKKIRNNRKYLKKINFELEKLNLELHDKVNEIKTLSGLLPICAQCKKIRNDRGYWEQLEGYISEHTSATFTHGICPNCAEVLYPEAMHRIRTDKPEAT